MKSKILFHVRKPNGVTVTLMEERAPAMRLAHDENCEVFELDTHTGRAVKIRSAQIFKAREYETSRPVSTPATHRAEERQPERVSFSFEDLAAEAV